MFNRLAGVYGLNRRNRELVASLNSPRSINLADDKVASKMVLHSHGIRTPYLIAVVRSLRELPRIYPKLEAQRDGFVIKPSRGMQGRAVSLYAGMEGDHVFPLHGAPQRRRDLHFLIASIVSGEFSSGRPIDCALIEERIKPKQDWIASELPGAADMRIVIVKGVPVMAMGRLPTICSGGRANLHKGAVGVGLDIASQRTTHAIWNGRPITHHPDTGQELGGRRVEGLSECLDVARDCGKALPLGFMGVDLMFDSARGPSVIEINARPGLMIQNANRMGLGRRLNELNLAADPSAEATQP